MSFPVAILLTLLLLFAVASILVALYRGEREQERDDWKRPAPYEPDAAMDAVAISVRVPMPRLPLRDLEDAS